MNFRKATSRDLRAIGDIYGRIHDHEEADWQLAADEDEVLVLHTLTVDPRASGHGYGRAFVASYEDLARDQGMKALRMDTNALNQRARGLYLSLGYREVGQVPTVFNGIDGVMLVLLEKILSE